MKKLSLIVVLFVVLFTVLSCNSNQGLSKAPNTTIIASENSGDSEEFDYKEYIGNYLWEESKKALSSQYELLGFKIEDYEEEYADGIYDAVFNYKIFYKNYDKDPDTVPHIKEAKEKGSPNYKNLYNKYLDKMEMNIEVRGIKYADGDVVLYEDSSPKKDRVWVELEFNNIIISNNM